MPLTVREQHQLIAALNNLKTASRVNKGDIKTLSNALDKVTNSKELLLILNTQMNDNFDINNPIEIKSFMDNVEGKLIPQKPSIYNKSLIELNNIGDRILEASQKKIPQIPEKRR